MPYGLPPSPSLGHCGAARAGPALLLAVPAALAAKKPPLHPINLSTATSAELRRVPGIGSWTADKVLKMRKAYGPLKSVDDARLQGHRSKRRGKKRKCLTRGKSTDAKKPPPAPTAAAHTPAKADSRRAAPPP